MNTFNVEESIRSEVLRGAFVEGFSVWGEAWTDLQRKIGSILRLRRNMRLSKHEIERFEQKIQRFQQFSEGVTPHQIGKRLNIVR